PEVGRRIVLRLQAIARPQIAIGNGLGLRVFIIRIPFIAFYNVPSLAGADPTAYWPFPPGHRRWTGFLLDVRAVAGGSAPVLFLGGWRYLMPMFPACSC
ncbi:MAG TPA: hypothetical protein VMT24_03060, partial [Aggregatilineaceae bacterium]|nr:hypothetical protein [Aggregatilineaceae bacterium]